MLGARAATAHAETDVFNNTVAIVVAIISACLALVSIKSANISQAAHNEQRAAASSWNQYQAKRLRQFDLQQRLAHADAEARDASGTQAASVDRPAYDALLLRWRTETNVYALEMKELASRARAHERRHKRLATLDDDFDVASAFLTLALTLLAVAALTRNFAILIAGVVIGGISVFFSALAFSGNLAVHPTFLLELIGVSLNAPGADNFGQR
ncbi:MAG: DUF4337 family protein [Pseudomonadota bacterium]